MGWKLAEEVADARPAKAGPEWWTLMDIALDARDDTRRGMPGEQFLMSRAQCSKATFYRRMEVLAKAGLVKTVRRAAPGVRAIYEVLPLIPVSTTGLTNAETRCVDNLPPTPPVPVDSRSPYVRNGSQKAFDTGLTPLRETHAVTVANLSGTGPVQASVSYLDKSLGFKQLP